MNAQDRRAVDRIDGVVREIAALNPSNPADVRAVSANLRTATAASRMLARAIAAIRAGDWSTVDAYLTEAERLARPQGGGAS